MLLAAAAAASAALAGCGGSDTPAAEAPEASAAPAFAQPHITSPTNGDTVAAKSGLGDNFFVKIPVSGTAQPDTKLDVGAGCNVAGCSDSVTSDATGKFEATVTARGSVDEPNATIIVGYQLADSTDSDRIVITITPPEDGGGLPTSDQTGSEGKTKRKKRPRSSKTPSLPSATVEPPAATAPPVVTAAPNTSTAGTGTSGTAVVVGDSLAEGMAPYLKAAMPKWKLTISSRVGRPLAEGMKIFASTPISPGTVSAFSLFTNDGPGSVGALESAVRTSVERSGCAVWATIVRPPVGGVSYDAANSKLRSLAAGPLAGKLRIVDWAAAAAQHPEWISSADGVHATAAGYQNRASLYAREIAACG